MPITTPLTTTLAIQHPILLAPMDLVADARLAAAVTQAGGLGLIGGGYGDETWLTAQLDAAVPARVGVGFITWSMTPRLLDLALERRPPAIMLSFGDVHPHAHRIKQAGAKLICQVQTLAQAVEALQAGADILVAQGAEAGGHGVARGTISLVPAIVDHAPPTVPVIAAGGIADGRGLAAALMLGASGALLGTRFYASAEAAAPSAAKQRILEASGDHTIRGILFDIARRNVWPVPFCGRVLRNAFSDQWQGREPELLQHHAEAARYAAARNDADFDTAAIIAGEAVDLIHDLPPAAALVARIVAEAETLLARAPAHLR